ncbi:hypothetical protein AB0A74_36180 [Saccharothrix sp. NPDC042600]|uniref:hypothetical protein n=1 Tax=Saccharothrix TaxID=2071 RepID=UPI003403DE83|nr:hypothetical protein GCM10017745_39770 [Saccharothrix mutabilis subsp. capreolus]
MTVEINVGGRAHGRLVVAVLVPALVVVVALVMLVRGLFTGGRAEWLVGSALSLGVVLVAPRLIQWVTQRLHRPRKLIIGPDGVRWDEPKGASWAYRWADVDRLVVVRNGSRVVLDVVTRDGRGRRQAVDGDFATAIDLALRQFAGDRYEGLR